MTQEFTTLTSAIGVLSKGLDRDHPAIAYTIERLSDTRTDFAIFEEDSKDSTTESFQELSVMQKKHARELVLAEKITEGSAPDRS